MGKSIPWHTAHGSVAWSRRHHKDAPQSLLWSWSKRSTLERRDLDLSPVRDEQAGLCTWLYCETPIAGALVVQCGTAAAIDAKIPAYQFSVNLDFCGWRAVRIQFRADARAETGATALSSIEACRLLPPTDAGKLYLDRFEFLKAAPQRTADDQVPAFNGPHTAWWAEWPMVFRSQKPRVPQAPVSDSEASDLARIEARYREWLLGGEDAPLTPIVERGWRQLDDYIGFGWRSYRELGLQVDADGWITGPSLHMRKGDNTFHHVFYNVLLALVYDYKRNKSEAALEAALRVFDYVHDQGWADGSANGSLILNCLVFAPYCHSLYLLRDELRQTGRYDAAFKAALWYLNFGKSFSDFEAHYIETNADELRSTVFTSLVTLLSMEDSPQKVQYLRSWLKWLNSGLAVSPRFTGLIKPDGLGFHHEGVYAGAYATEAYEFCALAAYLLRGTQFAISEQSFSNLKHALVTQDTISNEYDVPYTTMGRMPHAGVRIFSAYAYLAMASDPIDPELAGIFMRLWAPESEYLSSTLSVDLDGVGGKFVCRETPGRLEILERFVATQSSVALPPQGFWSKPWGALAVHRRDDWLVSVKGWSQYVWNFEMHPKVWAMKEENVFARYWSYGTLQPITHGSPRNPVASGWALDHGWDWCRWPGTTAPHLPLDALYNAEESWACRFFAATTFCGAVECAADGVFAFKLHEHCYDPTLRAFKSYFFFDNLIVCLGSNIENRDDEYSVATTLFQLHMATTDMPLLIDGEEVRDFPYSLDGVSGRPMTMLDPYGNGYIIPDGDSLRLRRHVQHSRDAWNRGETRGAYSTCWFEHGHAPQEDGFGEVRYHYAMLMQTDAAALDAFAEAPGYEVLQQNHQAHIVRHLPSKTVAYVLFEADWELAHGPLLAVDTPVLATVREHAEGLRLTLAEPDLRLPKRRNMAYLERRALDTVARPSTVTLELRGHWHGSGDALNDCRVGGGRTELELRCAYGLTVAIELRPVLAPEQTREEAR